MDILIDDNDCTLMSDVTFPSHVSGLESFVDFDGDATMMENEDEENSLPQINVNTTSSVVEKIITSASNVNLLQSLNHTSSSTMTMFLKMSTPPMSQSVSNSNSLNESSMSLGKLEALQANMQDSFLNSRSEDSDQEKKLQQYLGTKENVNVDKKSSLSDIIEFNTETTLKKIAPASASKELNQTELDSLFLRDVRARLQLSNIDSDVSNHINDVTLQHIDEETILQDQPSTDIQSVESQIEMQCKNNSSVMISKSEEDFDPSHIDQVQRPNLDGNSSDSGDDVGIKTTSPATNFARTGLHTSRQGNQRFDLQQELEELNLRNNISEREHAEGGAEETELFGDGGGGDGSSGHSDSDMGGDGGVAVRTTPVIPVDLEPQMESETNEPVGNPLNREQPIGESNSRSTNVFPASVSSRQVQFALSTQMSSDSSQQEHTPTGNSLQPGDNNNDQSRLSARYFLAASTPFKTVTNAQSNMMTSSISTVNNWMDQSSFHMSNAVNESTSNDRRTLIGEEFQINTPSSATLSRLRQIHGNPPDWTLMSAANGNKVDDTTLHADSNLNFSNNTMVAEKSTLGQKNAVYNPFDSQSSETSFQVHLNQEFDIHGSSKSADFKATEKDLDALFDEDEKIVAMNNNSVYKDGNETGVSEWSVGSKINQISPRNDSKEDGRVSMYFKAKSNEMGKLCGDEALRPTFSNESHQIVTPPAVVPLPLLKETDSADKDKTIPLDAWNRTYKTFEISPVTPDDSQLSSSSLNKSETPKSRLTASYKRNSDTIFQKRQKRQLVGKEARPSDKAERNQQRNSSDQANRSSSLSHRKLSGQSKSPSSKRNSDQAEVALSKDELEQTIDIPVTTAEADILLASIREQQISLEGMESDQVRNLAKCIAAMTSTDFQLVYNLLLMLPKNKSNGQQVGASPPLDASYDTRLPRYSSSSASQQDARRSDPVSRPISSVIPMSTDSERFLQYPTSNNHNPPTYQYLHSTRINRHSDPQQMSVFYEPVSEHQRLAVSVSPVRQPYSSSSNDFVTPNLQVSNNHGYSNAQTDFQPLYRNTAMAGHRNFVPLVHNNASRSANSQSSVTKEFGNYNKVNGHLSGVFSNSGHSGSGVVGNSVHGVGVINNSGQRTVSASHFTSLHAECINFPKNISLDVTCINTTTTKVFKIYNSNSCWMQCQLKIVFHALNGEEFDEPGVLTIIPKVTIEPNSFDDVKLKFRAKLAGAYIFKIEILTLPVIADEMTTTFEWKAAPSMLNIEAVVEQPDIEVLLCSSKIIDFGEIPYSTSKLYELKILNKGRANVPLKLIIPQQNTHAFPHFQFITETTSAEEKQTFNVTAVGRKQVGLPMQPCIVKLKFHAPSAPEKGKLISSSDEPEKYSCQIEIESDTTPTFFISRILVNATVGVAKLHSLRTMQTISLSSSEGKQTCKIMPLQNAGNISLRMETRLVGSHLFTVSPSKLILKPGEERNVEIFFKSDSCIEVESQLIVVVLPDGDQYKWNLHGSAIRKPGNDIKPALLCNKLSLNWPGVAIGHSQLQKLILRNNSDTMDINLNMGISGQHSNFQIQNDFISEFQHSINKYEYTIKPQAELPVHVLFVPSSFSMINSSLNLRVTNGSTKYVIPLTGYGGCSHLDINGAKRLNDQLWIDMGDVYLGKTSTLNVMLRNSGSRAAFVIMRCYSDITARIEYPSTHVNISPNQFICTEKSSCQVKLKFMPLENDAIRSQEGTCTAAHLVIYSGDEVLRKEYKRWKSTSCKSSSNATLKSLCLEDAYSNEDCVTDNCSYASVADWESFFNASMSRTVIAMVATSNQQQQKQQLYQQQQQHKDMSRNEDQLHMNIIHETPARKLKTFHDFKGPDISRITKSVDSKWSVSPEQIIINTFANNCSGCKLIMVNYTNVPLPFEFIWPAQTLVITPSKDKIPPSSQLVVRVDAKPSFLSKADEIPWRGSLYIQCNGDQKCVQVQIRNDLVLEHHTPVMKGSHEPLLPVHDLSLIPHQQFDDAVTVHPHILEFPNTVSNGNTSSSFTIKNNSSSSVCRWILSSIAPPYLKSIDGKCEIVRATYSAFRFDKHSGKLNAREELQLPVTFLPRSGGIYSQFWDFEVTFEDKKPAMKIRLELMGQGHPLEQKNITPGVSRKQIGTATPIQVLHKEQKPTVAVSSNELKKSCRNVFVKDDVLEFPLTKAGQSAEMKFRLCNDTNEIQKVRVSGFRSPFSVIMKHVRLSVRPKSYIRVPVYFNPSIPDSKFEGLLILTSELEDTMCVQLVGRSGS